MNDLTAVQKRFKSLSVKDLLEARETYHVHLAHLENVVATAVGLYRIRKSDPDASDPNSDPGSKLRNDDAPRTLGNSITQKWSWPCVLVFVDKWLSRAEFAKDPDQMVPRRLYLPDGRVVPTCVIYAEDVPAAPDEPTQLTFPSNLVGGGYSLVTNVQGRDHAGSVACLVTDGDSTYALTNRHVTGPAGREVFTELGEDRVRVGVSHPVQVGRFSFADAYPDWPGLRAFSNLDAGLVRVDDLSLWTTQIFRVGALGQLVDLNTDTITLDLIGTRVRAYGASSGLLAGEIQALFYRYCSVGGFDYVADMLIGPRAGNPGGMLTRPGDSGTLWVVDDPEEVAPKAKPRKKATADAAPANPHRPIAVQWGGHIRTEAGTGRQFHYALATCLSTVCRVLDVDVLRGWNAGLPEYWGTIGHYTIGGIACTLAKSAKLDKLMDANVDRVSFDESTILTGDTSPAAGDFFPLADVPDTVWKQGQFKRVKENPNHFADMDEPGKGVFAGQDLFSISSDPAKIVPSVWNDFYDSIGVTPNHRGSLPFRVWQVYAAMVAAVKAGDVVGFVGAAGVLAHYVGDACQPLHCSRLHDGDPDDASQKGVHSAYETKMVGRFKTELFDAVKSKLGSKKAAVIVNGGHEAAVETIALMRRSAAALPPSTIIESYVNNDHKVAGMWDDLKDGTVSVIADGCLTLASLWESAWAEGSGNGIGDSKLKKLEPKDLEALYQDKDFVPSIYLPDMVTRTDLLP